MNKKYLSLILLILSFQFSFSQIRFQNLPDPAIYPERITSETIFATIPYQGFDETQAYIGQGEYAIYLDNTNGVLDKPIIILDGFDPGDGRDINSIYAGLSFAGQNLADILRNEGFDIVILNAPVYTSADKLIDGGADYIQRNAMVLTALIQKLNNDKVGAQPLVVIGPSMGGLIARYSLSYMETNSLNADTRLFISFDAPHRGANIPISLQYLINYFGESLGETTAQMVVDQLLNSPAAKQMLVDHMLGHFLAGSTYEQDPTKLLPTGAPNYRDEFQAELDGLGFPNNVRNVAIINGSGSGLTTGTPGMTIVDTNLTLNDLTSVDVALKFTPLADETNTATKVVLRFLGTPIETFQADSKSPNNSNGVDSAPGGTGSISDALGDGGGNPIMIDFINALQQDLYSFVPTNSSLAIDNPDWFEMPTLSSSPFDAFHIPEQNEPHVTMTAASIQFALDEIRNGVVGIEEDRNVPPLVFVQNPVKGTINISLVGNGAVNKLNASIISITGQQLRNTTWNNPTVQLNWEHNLSSGIYLLKLDTDNTVQTFKIIVE